MPTPVTKIHNVQSCCFGEGAFEQRPRHMEAAFRIVVAAAAVDHWLGNMFIGLSPPSAVRLAKLFNTSDNETKKSASVEAVATVLLPPDMHDLLRSVIKRAKGVTKLRHPFAHSRFGWTDDDKDLLLVVDRRVELISRARDEAGSWYLDAKRAGTAPALSDVGLDGPAEADFLDGVSAYTLDELVDIRNRIRRAETSLTHFWQLTSIARRPEDRERLLARLRASLAQ